MVVFLPLNTTISGPYPSSMSSSLVVLGTARTCGVFDSWVRSKVGMESWRRWPGRRMVRVVGVRARMVGGDGVDMV